MASGRVGQTRIKPPDHFVRELEGVAEQVPFECLDIGPNAGTDSRLAVIEGQVGRMLTGLSLSHHNDSDQCTHAVIDTLSRSKHLQRLRELKFTGFDFVGSALGRLANLGTLPPLDHLQVWAYRSSDIGAGLDRSHWGKSLRSLEVAISQSHGAVIGIHGHFPNLTHLRLPSLPSRSLMEFLNAEKTVPRLDSLNLNMPSFSADNSAEPVGELVRPLRHVELTSIYGGRVFVDAIRLLRSSGLRSLASLVVSTYGVSADGWRGLVPSIPSESLRHLSFRGVVISDQNLGDFIQMRCWADVTKASISAMSLTSTEIAPDFFRSWDAPALRQLSISGVKMRSKGGLALAANRSFANLRMLTLDGGTLGEKAVRAILNAQQFQNLLVLRMVGTGGGKGFDTLSDPAVLPHARRIVLQGNNVPPALAEKLRARPGLVIR